MKRPRSIRLVLVVVVLVLGLLAFGVLSDREPRCQGRTLTQWIDFEEQGPWEKAKWETTRNAVRQIGTSAIPFLLKELRAKDSPLKQKLIVWLDKYPSLPLKIKPAERRQHTAIMCFNLLADEAKPAWPVLTQLAYSSDKNLRLCAIHCLVESRADKEILVALFQRLMHDPDKEVSKMTAFMFRNTYREEADAAGVEEMFPEFKEFP